MKNILTLSILMLSFLLASCSGLRVIPQDEFYVVTGYDFTEYTAKGFHITPERYLGTYEPIGVIRIQYIPEFIREGDQTAGMTREQLEQNYVRHADPTRNLVYWHVSKVSADNLIREAYEAASAMGANPITHFEITSDSYQNGSITVPSAVLRGFAIKRLD
ncbi:MAG: hypothetical protein LAT75_10455 [Candidatus Cyclonatronum sp.]|uniref:hypothetical protein n=1 Tax=Cyclonatronum sp. TaxID=3024185 RepID=UPI0025C50B0C|nr:hypothetical protein [Cyclonatronum sp.]MCH8487279.1 hypothetical protein [Cyclonatronum sp.]